MNPFPQRTNIVEQGLSVVLANLDLDAPDREAHDGKAAGGGVAWFRLLSPQSQPGGSLC